MYVSANENVRMALGAVWTHRFRSLLTILGIVIGITTVVTVASLLTGLRQGVVTFFQEFGPDNIFIYKTSGDPNQVRVPEKEARRRPIREEYASTLRRWSMTTEGIGVQLFIPPIVGGRPLIAKVRGFESDNFSLVGQTSNLLDLSPREFSSGRSFTAEEEARGARVAVIGADLSAGLFPDGKAVGQPLMMDGAEFTVIGVYQKAKGGFFGANGLDTQVAIPLSAAKIRYPQVDRFLILCKAKPGQRKNAYEEIEGLMRRIRRVPTDAENDFSISTPDQIIQQFDRITGLVGLVAIAISGLGLLVGGIGVMNIMLVSVTERTREIGVRKAVGARKRDIIGQFLAEAMTLTGLGGVLGVIIAVLVTLLVSV
ncbi:MAG: ABC transporter permease, partial [Bryobacteraceae bacterium]